MYSSIMHCLGSSPKKEESKRRKYSAKDCQDLWMQMVFTITYQYYGIMQYKM